MTLDERTSARIRTILLAELAGLRASSDDSRDARKPVELDQQSVGRLSRMDALQNQAMAAGADARRGQRMRAIEAALIRLQDGEFGYCDECGDPIAPRRLELDPCVVRCVECAS